MQTRYVVAAFALLALIVYLSIKHLPGKQPSLAATSPTTVASLADASLADASKASDTPAASSITPHPQDNSATPSATTPAVIQPPIPPERKIEPIPMGDAHRQAIEKFKALTGGQDEITPLHTALANEPRDIDWSYGMEEQLNRFLVSRGAELGIEAPVIACRATGCEIQLITYKKPPAFDQLLGALRQEPWFNLTTINQARVPVSSDAIAGWLFLKRP